MAAAPRPMDQRRHRISATQRGGSLAVLGLVGLAGGLGFAFVEPGRGASQAGQRQGRGSRAPRLAERSDIANAVVDFRQGRKPTATPRGTEDWTDYTRYALGVKDYVPQGPEEEGGDNDRRKFYAFTDRKRSLGVDFGPQFTGLALSLGGVNSMPLGTLQTGVDWKETAVKVVQIASTRRVKDIVVGQPLEKDGSEGRISMLVRHFSQLLADATLLMLGGNTTVYLWDERFSTTYAAMRLVVRPKFEGGAFKNWLDGQRGLDFGRKALLDAEAARAILEHFLSKDGRTERLNKELAERVSPSREACRAYLKWKRRPLLRAVRPEEPAGPGREAWEWDDLHPDESRDTAEAYMEREENFDRYMEGMDRFGDRQYEWQKRRARELAENDINKRIKNLKDEAPMREAFKEATGRKGDERVYQGLRFKRDGW